MYSLKDMLSALDSGDTLSFREATNPGAWPPVTDEGRNHSLLAWCRRFAAAGKAVRRMKDDERNVWVHMSRGAVLGGVRSRLRNPFTVDQGETHLCGPCALAVLLAWRQPVDYVNAIAEIQQTGVFTTKGGYTFTADFDLRARSNPESVIQADWLFIATVRDSANLHDDVDNGRGIEGMTLPPEVHWWVDQMLDLTPGLHWCLATGEIDALRAGQAAIDAGGIAILLIDVNQITSGGVDHEEHSRFRFRAYAGGGRGQFGDSLHSEDDRVPPDHLVVLDRTNLGSDLAEQGELHVFMWSWSRQYQVVATPEGFSEYLYAVMTGVPR